MIPGDFLDELDASLLAIRDAPERHHVVSGRLRRVLLKSFPCGAYYKLFPDVISVVGVIHGHRHPRRRRDGQVFVLKPERVTGSPLDVPGLDLSLSREEIVRLVHEGRRPV